MPTEFKSDNKKGMFLCNMLMVKKLNDREREFITSIQRQILDRPTKFKLSKKQALWLADIWARYK